MPLESRYPCPAFDPLIIVALIGAVESARAVAARGPICDFVRVVRRTADYAGDSTGINPCTAWENRIADESYRFACSEVR